MQRIFALILVLASASTANAWPWITVDGLFDPPDEIWIEPSDIIVIGIFGDGVTGNCQEFYMQIAGPASYDLSEVTCPWNPYGLGAVDLGDGLLFIDLAGVTLCGVLPSNVLLDGIKIHGEGEGDVTVTMFDRSWTVLDTQIFHQSYLGANWRFDEGSGTVASDSVGDNDGVMYGPNWTAGQIAGALSFDGEDDYVDCGDDESLNLGIGSFSVSAWIRPDSLGMNEGRGIVSKWQDEANRWYLHTFEDWVGFTSKADDVWVYRTWTKGFMEAGQWYHICFVGDGTEGKLYVNGADRAFTRLYLPASLDNNAPVMIGYNNNSASPAYFDGTIDDVRLYKKALSEAEIREYYRDNGGAYTFYIDANDGNDTYNGISAETAFATIQKAIDIANDGDRLTVAVGQYTENINFLGKNIIVTSTDPDDSGIVKSTIIDGTVTFRGTEDANCTLTGFNINGPITGYDPMTDPAGENHTHANISHCILENIATGCGGVIQGCDGIISHCLIANISYMCLRPSPVPQIIGCHGLIENCTMADMADGIEVLSGGTTTLRNCILHRSSSIIVPAKATLNISYCNMKREPYGIFGDGTVNWGPGNIEADPCFADAGSWQAAGDYHLKSQAGHYDANDGGWTTDEVTSLCIDAGDPATPIDSEPFPNGGIVNMGVFGGTPEASKSYFGKPPCTHIVAGDVNGDCIVDFKDAAITFSHWLEDAGP